MLIIPQVTKVADAALHRLKPPERDGVQRNSVGTVDDEIVVPRRGWVLKHERCGLMLEHAVNGSLGEIELEREPVERGVLHRARDNGPASNDDGIFLRDSCDGVGTLREASAGADHGAEAGITGGANGGDVGIRNRAVATEECAIKIDGEQVVAAAGANLRLYAGRGLGCGVWVAAHERSVGDWPALVLLTQDAPGEASLAAFEDSIAPPCAATTAS